MEKREKIYSVFFLAIVGILFLLFISVVLGCTPGRRIRNGQMTRGEQYKEQFLNEYEQGRISKDEYQYLMTSLKDLDKM